MAKLFLSYARNDDEPFVWRLYKDLIAAGFDVWFDRVSMPSRQLTFYQEIRDAIEEGDRLILVVGPNAVESNTVEQEWRFALEADKCVNPIVRLDSFSSEMDGYSLIPEELALFHAEDFRDDTRYNEHIKNLIRQLSEPPPRLGEPISVPTLPMYFRSPREHLREVRKLLLVNVQKPIVVTGASTRVGVQGMGGIGKSVLANALARDLEVRRAFPDGIFWIPMGQKPDIVDTQRRLVSTLGGDTMFDDAYHGRECLRNLFAERTALLILDNVWRGIDVEHFDVAGIRCKLLITTRDTGLVTSCAGTGYDLKLPTTAEALALLAAATGVSINSLSAQAEEIVSECGRLPLALSLCGSMAKKGLSWNLILRALQEARLEFITEDHKFEEHHRSIWRAMEVSVQLLPPEHQRRFAELSVFVGNESIPERAVVTLWEHTGQLDALSASFLLQEFHDRSLIQIDRPITTADLSQTRIRLHDLLHDFSSRLADNSVGRIQAIHSCVLNAYEAKCTDGWSTGPNDGYFLEHLRFHFVGSGRGQELADLLTQLEWLEAKNAAGLTFDLLHDYSAAMENLEASDDRRVIIQLLGRALSRDIHFIARHAKDYPQGLFQCLWNSCWWYDSPRAARFYRPPAGGWPKKLAPWKISGPKLYKIVEKWLKSKENDFYWVRLLVPDVEYLGTTSSRVLSGHLDYIQSMAFSPEGNRIVSGSDDGTIRVWDVNTGSERLCIDVDPDAKKYDKVVNSVSFSPNGYTILSGTNGGIVQIWDANRGIERLRFGEHSRIVESASFSPDGQRVISRSQDELCIWNVEDASEVIRIVGKFCANVAFDRQGERFVCADRNSGSIHIYNASDGRKLVDIATDEVSYLRKPHSMAFSPDSKRIAILSSDLARICDTYSGVELQRLDCSGHSVDSVVAFSADGEKLITQGYGSCVRIWNSNGVEVMRLGTAWPHVWKGLAVSPNSEKIATSGCDSSIRIWSSQDYAEPAQYNPILCEGCHDGSYATPCFSTNGRYIACDVSSLTDEELEGGREKRPRDLIIWDVVSAKRRRWLEIPICAVVNGWTVWVFAAHLLLFGITYWSYREALWHAAISLLTASSLAILGWCVYCFRGRRYFDARYDNPWRIRWTNKAPELKIESAETGESVAWLPFSTGYENALFAKNPRKLTFAGRKYGWLSVFSLEGGGVDREV